ncbi:MAG: HepT-like ribonuclease domain-containing protein [Pseudanabaenaceae cyanobacterium bins.39]|nr:HepT-like ribonuclease domain-containing protein [Pseudanabaenaceae cyanobacterium bins.39]
MTNNDLSIPIETDNNYRLEVQIQDILEAIAATESFVKDLDFLQFSRDQKTIFATERAIGIIGATARRLPINFIDQYPQVNWRRLISISDSLMFGYLEIDLNTLWEITQEDAPFIRQIMQGVVDQLAANPSL